MKKQKPKPPLPPPDFLPACRKLDKAVRFSFLRTIKKVRECTMQEAETLFETAVKSGAIVQDGENLGGDVKFFRAKACLIK